MNTGLQTLCRYKWTIIKLIKNEKIDFIKSERGKNILVHDCFLYRFESKNYKKNYMKMC